MNDLTEIVYLDCNRQNSVSSEFNTNEWEYKIGDEGLVLPAGTQISIQNSIINKKGFTGSSIVIDNDIDDIISINYYTTDNEGYVPVGAKVSNPNDDAQYESLYDTTDKTASGSTFFRNDIGKTNMDVGGVDTVIPVQFRGHGDYLLAAEGGRENTQIDDVGKSESPLSAVKLVNNQNFSPNPNNFWEDFFIEPLTKDIEIFVPKGVYGVSQIAQLIEDQINGRLIASRVRLGDYSTDFSQQKARNIPTDNILSENTTSNFDNDTTYIMTRNLPVVNQTNWDRPYIASNLVAGFNSFITDLSTPAPPQTGNTLFFATKSAQFGATGAGTVQAPYVLAADSFPQQGVLLIPQTMEKIQYNGWTVIDGTVGGGFERGGLVRVSGIQRGVLGTTARIIPARCYVRLDIPDSNYAAGQNPDFVPPTIIKADGTNDPVGLFTIPMYVNRMRKDYLTPPTTREDGSTVIGAPTDLDKYNSRKKYLYARNANYSEYNPQNSPHPQNPARPAHIASGGIPTLNGGGNYYTFKDAVPLAVYLENEQLTHTSNTDFDYNVHRNGYYIGTPDFKMSFDTNVSAYILNNLHQSWRVPAYDQYGNQIENAGSEGVMLKRLCESSKYKTYTDDQDNPDFVHPTLRQNYQQTVQRYGGISVYNWARNVAQKFGDKDWRNPVVYNQDKLHLLTFNDYFTSEKMARTAWKKSLWFRLGFTYDQLCNEDSYEENKYYNREIGGEIAGDNSKLFGTTTRPDLGVGAASAVATSYNPTEILVEGTKKHIAPRIYGNQDINTPWREAGTDMVWKSMDGNTEDHTGKINNIYSYFGSFWKITTGTIVLTSGRPLKALHLPTLNEQGYYIITSDILEAHEDSVKNSKGLGLLGVIPFSQQATNDFMSNSEPLIHILNQRKIVNSIKFKVLYPNLTNPEIDPNSSVILKIVRPVVKERKTDPNEQSNQDHKSKSKA